MHAESLTGMQQFFTAKIAKVKARFLHVQAIKAYTECIKKKKKKLALGKDFFF